MNNSLPKMLDSLPAAMFEKSPLEELAIRVRNPAGLAWEVADSKLRLTLGGNVLDFDGLAEFSGAYDFGVTHREYDLSSLTLGELADVLRADGNQVLFEDLDMAGRSALTLLPGSNNQDRSNGDHLYAFTSLLWSILATYESEVDAAAGQIPEALRQMVMTQAEGEWLDEWMNLYGIPRLPGEEDAAGQVRLPQEVFRQRVNPLAIEQAVLDLAGESVRIDEPWRRMFSLDASVLSGAHAMPDGEYFTYHVIQPVTGEGGDMAKAMPIIVRNKPAGVDIYAPRIDFLARIIDMLPAEEFDVVDCRSDVRGAWLNTTSNQLLDVLRLSSDEPVTINHLAAQHWVWQFAQEALPEDSGNLGFQFHQFIPRRREIAKASVCLSDGVAMGDENGVLSRGIVVRDISPAMSLSGSALLSAVSPVDSYEQVESISIAPHSLWIQSEFAASAEMGRVDIRSDGAAMGDLGVASEVMTGVVGSIDFVFDGYASYDGLYQYEGGRGY